MSRSWKGNCKRGKQGWSQATEQCSQSTLALCSGNSRELLSTKQQGNRGEPLFCQEPSAHIWHRSGLNKMINSKAACSGFFEVWVLPAADVAGPDQMILWAGRSSRQKREAVHKWQKVPPEGRGRRASPGFPFILLPHTIYTTLC